jgi:lipopolysaccharide export system protein LptC
MSDATFEMPAVRRMSANARSAAMFARARRHSVVVRLLRKIIPVAAAGAVAVLIVLPVLTPLTAIGGLALGPVRLSGTEVTMENPRMTGYRKDNTPYEVTALTAKQDIRRPNTLTMNEMKAVSRASDQGTVTLTSKTAVFETQKEQLQLREGVIVVTDSGYDIRMDSADADFKAGTIISKEPVKVTSKQMRILADSAQSNDNGKSLSFNGRVRSFFVTEGTTLPPETEPTARQVAAPVPVIPAAEGATP